MREHHSDNECDINNFYHRDSPMHFHGNYSTSISFIMNVSYCVISAWKMFVLINLAFNGLGAS